MKNAIRGYATEVAKACFLYTKEYLSLKINPKSRDFVTHLRDWVTFTITTPVSHISLLLKYCDRFYHRQFITRKMANNDLLIKFEYHLNSFFNEERLMKGLPAVQDLASRLNVSPNYLSDMLRTLTGQSTQQHIQRKIIEQAKIMLTTTNLSVNEIAYSLGFDYPQSLQRLFKNYTKMSPIEFRRSFN